MATEMIPERCAEHKMAEAEVLSRLKMLEEDVKELHCQLRGKVDNGKLDDMIQRSTKEIEELKNAILRLNAADLKHSEALAGIHQTLLGFKETQDLMRRDYSKLTECYTQTSVHIASITAILAERAKKEESKVTTPKIEISTDNDPWYVRLVGKNKILTYAVTALIVAIIWILVSHFNDIAKLLQNIFGK